MRLSRSTVRRVESSCHIMKETSSREPSVMEFEREVGVTLDRSTAGTKANLAGLSHWTEARLFPSEDTESVVREYLLRSLVIFRSSPVETSTTEREPKLGLSREDTTAAMLSS